MLVHLGNTTARRYKIKEVLHPGWVEFKAVIEIFSESRVLCRHQGPAFRASRSDAVADTTSQAITSWGCSNKDKLQNSIRHLLPYWMDMVHHEEVMVELRTRLLPSQQEIETLRIQLWNTDATIRGYMRMVEG
jgi:hypothetical protein